jgi:hypothetical protein
MQTNLMIFQGNCETNTKEDWQLRTHVSTAGNENSLTFCVGASFFFARSLAVANMPGERKHKVIVDTMH